MGRGLGSVPARDFEMAAVGYRIYNCWLADFASVQPERHVGLNYLPTWDPAAAAREAEWAREAGLKGVNFPPPGRPGHLPYNHPDWEPFWATAASLGLPLTTHSSGAHPINYHIGPGGTDIMIYETGGWLGRRALWWLVHGQVFERHPHLRLVVTEQFEGWWNPTLLELDSVHARFGGVAGGSGLPRKPSDYVRSNAYLGASFLSADMASEASATGYAGNVMWGLDYPHVEGTFQHGASGQEAPVTQLALRNTFAGLSSEDIRAMAGANACAVYGLDGATLGRVARRIGAPSVADLAVPPGPLPAISPRSNAFRGQAGSRREPAGQAAPDGA